MTYRELLKDAALRLKDANILFCDTPTLDASLLLCFAAGITREKLLASYPDEVDVEISKKFDALLSKRISGLPVSYIRNVKEFYGRDFYVDKSVLVPRPDTEVIIEKALTQISRKAAKVLDLCTGSGCIGITLKLENPAIDLTASDISKEALETASKNAKELGAKIELIESDLFQNISSTFDLIITNPPYLKTSETIRLKHSNWSEPMLALDGGEDGMYFIHKIINQSVSYLNKGSCLLIESGFDQAEKIKKLLIKAGFSNIEIIKDIEGRNRVISGIFYGTCNSKV